MKQEIYLVFGGALKDVTKTEFKEPDSLRMVGVFLDYPSAENAWRANTQQTVDDAEMRFFIVPLHEAISA